MRAWVLSVSLTGRDTVKSIKGMPVTGAGAALEEDEVEDVDVDGFVSFVRLSDLDLSVLSLLRERHEDLLWRSRLRERECLRSRLRDLEDRDDFGRCLSLSPDLDRDRFSLFDV